MAYGLPNGNVTDDVTWPWKVKLVTPIRLERNISKTTWARDFKFGTQLFYRESRAGAQIIFYESGRGLGHVNHIIFGSTVGYRSDSLASCCLIDTAAHSDYCSYAPVKYSYSLTHSLTHRPTLQTDGRTDARTLHCSISATAVRSAKNRVTASSRVGIIMTPTRCHAWKIVAVVYDSKPTQRRARLGCVCSWNRTMHA